MFNEDNLAMISALQHILFCPRQCALIHIEQQWTENRFTAEGKILHERVHSTGSESRRKIRVEFDVPIRSLRLGLIGRADIVEFHLQDNGIWQPYPVEYKRGRPKKDDSDRVQLCAQGLCLEEMLNCEVTEGALYYGQKKRRQNIPFDAKLRKIATDTAERLHILLDSNRTPPPEYTKKCESCSFISQCLPKIAGKKSVSSYLRQIEAQ
ncbi:MAG: CRISPR-associated protein Cas4 [Desulfocapsa sp.]|nr:CRISPR-associated protein Cas4 [Desulfocapsa sp.]